MKNLQALIIFGNNQTAQLAKYYLENDEKYRNKYKIIAFTVHKKYRKTDTFEGLPLVDFETLQDTYPPKGSKLYGDIMLFAPMTGKGLNKIREQVYLQGLDKGYKFISYISSKATVLTDKIGDNCFILEDNTIQPFVTIGNNCILWSGNHIGHHSVIKDNVFLTSHIVVSGNCVIEPYCWLGVNATLRNAITLAEGTLVAMSASIVKSTQPYTVYMGVPGKEKGKSDEPKVANSL